MSIKIYFGVPGSGKTTLAAKIAHDNLKKGITTYSNVPIKGTILFETSDLGKYDISDGEMIIDEAGIVFNNRKFKTMPQHVIEWFKLSRHYGIKNIHIFSQSYDDMDITLRRLCDEIYVVKRSIFPFVFSIRRIMVKVGIDKETHQIMDMYFFQFLGIRPYLGYHYWHMFDSWSAPDLVPASFKFSGYPSYTIDKTHSKIIYKELHKQGRLKYKLFHNKLSCLMINNVYMFFYKIIITRKRISEKSARTYNRFLGLSRNKINYLSARNGRSRPGDANAPANTEVQSTTIEMDDIEYFRQFFQREEQHVKTKEKDKKEQAI